MIHFTRQDNKVYCHVATGLQTVEKIEFIYTASSNLCAEMLLCQLQQKLYDRVEAVRKEEYNAGWKDKTRHLAKCKYFFTTLNLKKS